MTGLNKAAVQKGTGYCEESPRLAIIITVIVILLVGVPLGLLNKKISDEGSRDADVSLYADLANKVGVNVRVVGEMLEKGVVDVVALAAVAAPKVTLITPDINPTNMQEAASQDPNKLNVTLSAIYWNPSDPLVTIDNENYRVGDKVKGFTILEIRKTEVVFRSPLGDKVVKYFYDYLN
jgi:hypothetical protein